MLINCVSNNVKFIDVPKNSKEKKAVTFRENLTEIIPPSTLENVTGITRSGLVAKLTREAGGVPATLLKEITSQETDDELDKLLPFLWMLEQIGISDEKY